VYASFCLLGFLTTAPLGIATWKAPQGRDWAPLIACSLLAIGAQLLMTFSLRWVDAMTVGVISQLAVLVSMALGATILRETITPMGALGSVLTIGGVVGVMYVTSIGKRIAAADEVVPEA
jgi:drug/metabolite transporter (DMT)-like permease